MQAHRWLLYLAWILVCGALALGLRHNEDPSRRSGRILSNDAGILAVKVLRGMDRAKYRDYEPVHEAWEGNRWIVLCDRVPHTGLAEAVVVEVDGKTGAVVRIRKPVN